MDHYILIIIAYDVSGIRYNKTSIAMSDYESAD